MIQELTGVAMLTMWIADRFMGRPQRSTRDGNSGGGRARGPVKFAPEQAARFTRIDAGARSFDVSRTSAILETLRFRSATPVTLPGVDARAGVWAWEVGPLRADRDCAADVVERALARGMVPLGSLSLILLRTGHPVDAVLVVAQSAAAAARLASPQGDLAILRVAAIQPQPVAGEPTLAPPAAPAAAVRELEPTELPAPVESVAVVASAVESIPAPGAVVGQVTFPKGRSKANGATPPKQEIADVPASNPANA
jgi:hypothetical protein